MSFPNHYNTLGISRYATKKEIQAAFKKLSLQWHPDINNSPDALEKFAKINRAYQFLSNKATKKAYDKEYDHHYNRLLRRELKRDFEYFIIAKKFQPASVEQKTVKAMTKLTCFGGAHTIVYVINCFLYFYTGFLFYEGVRYGDAGFILLSLLFGLFAIAGSALQEKLKTVTSPPLARQDRDLSERVYKLHFPN